MSQTKRTAVTEAALHLSKLLDEPEPGLATWHLMCERAYQAILVAAATGPDEPAMLPWSTEKRPVPGIDGWRYATGKGGPCWYVVSDSDSYTHVTLLPNGYVDSRNAPVDVVRWLLTNAPNGVTP